MSLDAQHPGLRQFCLVLRIVVAAVGAGPTIFLIVANSSRGAGQVEPALGIVLVALLATAVPVWFVVPPLIIRNVRRQILRGAASTKPLPLPLSILFTDKDEPVGRLLAAYQAATLLRVAILEGPSFYAVVLYMLHGSPLYAGVAAVLVVLIFLHFPSPSRIAAWVERQQRLIDDDRLLGLDR